MKVNALKELIQRIDGECPSFSRFFFNSVYSALLRIAYSNYLFLMADVLMMEGEACARIISPFKREKR